jgi:uncharacterized GH25 family protein
MKKRIIRAAAALALVIPVTAHAHKAWLLPSSTVLSGKGDDLAVTIDAAVSNDLFYFEHRPLRLEGLVVTGPDGAKVEAENAATGKYRSTFDLPLKAPGTYRIALVMDGLMGSYKENGEQKRWRGTAAELSKIPATATDLKVTESSRRLETFVTAGKPSGEALKPLGKGLELEPVTHPNDLVEKSEATFKLLLDGKPAAGVKVEIVPGGIRYRNQVGDATVTTGADGVFKYTWPAAGMYWLEASLEDDKTSVKEASKRRASYAVTLEVLPE